MKLCDVSVRAENRQESFPGFSLLNQQCSMLQPFTQKTKNSHTKNKGTTTTKEKTTKYQKKNKNKRVRLVSFLVFCNNRAKWNLHERRSTAQGWWEKFCDLPHLNKRQKTCLMWIKSLYTYRVRIQLQFSNLYVRYHLVYTGKSDAKTVFTRKLISKVFSCYAGFTS